MAERGMMISADLHVIEPRKLWEIKEKSFVRVSPGCTISI